MEYNEPLNLSIKKKPIAVVIPSSSSTSSNKGDAIAPISNGMDRYFYFFLKFFPLCAGIDLNSEISLFFVF